MYYTETPVYSKNRTIGVAKLVDWDWEFSIFVSLALDKTKPRADRRDLPDMFPEL